MVPAYIGITDFVSSHQVRVMRSLFARHGGTQRGRVLAVGVMMSRKTLCHIPTRWAQAFPPNEDVQEIFLDDPSLFNVLHYADNEEIDFADCLRMASAFGGRRMEAIQLDMRWPNAAVIREYRETTRDVSIILQVSRRCFTDAEEKPVEIVRRLREYGDAIDAVLLDCSMGSGIVLRAERLLPHLHAIAGALPRLRLVVAGGLGPSTMEALDPILAEFPSTSWDAQARLRASNNALEPIDWDFAGKYLAESIRRITPIG